MENHLKPDNMDTKTEDQPQTPAGSAADFDEATRPGDLWPEAADALCSEHAALFAGTQPAPLSVV